MNRRDALKLLAGLPLLGFLKPEAVEADNPIFFDIVEESREPKTFTELIRPSVRWNGAGDSWKSEDGGKTWVQTHAGWSAAGPDGVIFAKGIRATTEPDENIILRFNAD